jgi:hypothetical protein
MHRKVIVASLVAIFMLVSASAFGATGEKVKNKGVIMLRAGDTLTVKTSEGVFTVTINSDTKIQRPVGLTGMRKKDESPDVLIPGLKMKFEGVSGDQENQVIAKTITFDEDDLALAEVIRFLSDAVESYSRGFVPICPKKCPKRGVEFRLQLCKKEVVKILGSLHGCKFNMQKG